MTDYPSKKSKENRYRSNSRLSGRDSIELLDDLPDQEDAIDRLLLNSDFIADDNENERWHSVPDDQADEFTPDVVSRFLIRRKADASVQKAAKLPPSDFENSPIKPTVPIANSVLGDFYGVSDVNGQDVSIDLDDDIDPVEIATGDAFDVGLLREHVPISEGPPIAFDIDLKPGKEIDQSQVDGIAPETLAELIAKRQVLDQERDKLIEQLADNNRKAVLLGKIVLVFASVALVLSLTLAVFLYKHIDLFADRAIAEKKIGANVQIQNIPDAPENATTMPAKSTWYVHLAAFRQLNDAAEKAKELIKKGVRTELLEVKTDNGQEFRLRVGGFSNREQAEVYADKISKSLHLDSVVIDNQ